MDPENSTSTPEVLSSQPLVPAGEPGFPPANGAPTPPASGGIRWVFLGPQGLRAGWSVAIFIVLFAGPITGLNLLVRYLQKVSPLAAKAAPVHGLDPWTACFGEGIGVLFLILIVFLMSLMERRSLLAYNLAGPRKFRHFLQGVGSGFLFLSILVGALAAGGWLHVGGVALSGVQIAIDAAAWGLMFFFVGCMEEGIFRCYLQFTLARGVNFWWALVVVGAVCGELLWKGKGNGIWGVYIMAALGLIPCFWLHLTRRPGNGFWQAAWVTSTLFGFVHTGNNGENWIGIFSAAAIGAVFCISIRVTGSAWWAIGCHAGWDWAQTYFYGVADSGLKANGHLLSTSPIGKVFWSGGADGPEGSVLVIPVVTLILIFLIVFYGRRRIRAVSAAPAEPATI